MSPNNESLGDRIAVLLFTDIVDSVDLQQRLGTVEYSKLLETHDRIYAQVLEASENGERYQDTGDGHLARFGTAADGVTAALRFQALLETETWPGERPQVRIGIHQGHVTEIQPTEEGPTKTVGMALNIAARIMGLADGGQILLTRAVFDDARQYVRSHPAGAEEPRPPAVEWKAHGKYLLKGNDEPVEVFQVGSVRASFTAPQDSDKAVRAVTAEEEATLGWRPATGLPVPHREGWVLERQLGEGGFGEVWLALHEKLKEQRVYKFCFDADRLRSFKREVTLFRLIRSALGARNDITVIHDIHLNDAPYFLELDYAEAGDLKHWAEKQGGIDKLPLQRRLDIVATIAKAVGAAHSVGIIHKDIKPSNILIRENRDETIQPQLMDFGIGFLGDTEKLDEAGITAAGFTETVMQANESSRTGTRMYAPPETLAGMPYTIQGDIYALGVLLYQMTVGDLSKPLAVGWEKQVEDELLKKDISECVAGEPTERLTTAAELTERIQGLETRAKDLAIQREAERRATARRRLVRASMAASTLLLFITTILTVAYFREKELKRHALTEWAAARSVSNFINRMLTSIKPEVAKGMDRQLLQLILDNGASEISTLNGQPEIQARLHSTIGSAYHAIGAYREAKPHYLAALELNKRTRGDEHSDTLAAMVNLALFHKDQGQYKSAELLYTRALRLQERVLGRRHRDTLATINNLAVLARLQGNHNQANRLSEEFLKSQKQTADTEQLTATAMNNRAGFFEAQGDYQKAEELYTQSLELAKRQLGETHPNTLRTMNNLAVLYAKLRQFKKAQLIQVQTLELRKRILGSEHPDTLSSMNNLAELYRLQGLYDNADSIQLQTLEIQKRTLGAQHPDTLSSMNNLGLLRKSQGRYDEAESLYTRALEAQKRVLGADKPTTLKTMANLAGLYQSQREYEKAQELWIETLELQRKVLGAEHRDTLGTMYRLAVVYLAQKDYQSAEPLLVSALELHQRVLGSEHYGTLLVAKNLAMVHMIQGNHKKARALFTEALRIGDKTLSKKHRTVVSIRKILESLNSAGAPKRE